MELNAAIIALLKEQAEVIRFETQENQNTAERVGAMFISIIEALNKLIDLSDIYLKKHEEDTADALITFLAGINIGEYIKNVSGANIDAEGNAEFNSLLVRLDSVFKERLSSPEFISGFLSGKGWSIMKDKVKNALGIEEDKYTLEIDNVIIRGSLRVYEMIISQLLGENDNRIFTAMLEVDHYDPETGKIWLDTQDGKMYNPFRKDDYIMVQQYNGMPSEENGYYVTKSYEFIITDAGIGSLSDGEKRLDWVEFENFTTTMDGGTPDDLITKGDTLVRIDNASDPNRKGIIQVITVGEKTPYLDVIYGRKTDPDNYLKGRLGNLEGIRNELFGWLQGFGEYLTNLYAVGDFRLRRTGDDLDSMIEMLRTQFASRYSSLTYDITEEENYLYNATFTENMDGWEVITDTATVIMDSEDAFLINGNLYLSDSTSKDSTHRATLSNYDDKQMLYLYDSGIIQRNKYITQPSTHKVYDETSQNSSTWDQSMTDNLDEDYKTEKDTLYLAIKFLAKKSGTLTIGFQGASNDGSALPNPATIEVSSSIEWQTLYWQGTWDGKGDFILSYTGEMYVAQLSLTSDPLSDYKREIGTQIIQTANNIRLLGYNLDSKTGKMTDLGLEISAVDASIRLWVSTEIRDEYTNLIKETEIKLTEDMISMRAALQKEFQDADGELKSLIEQTGIEIRSDVAKIYATKEEVNQVTGDIKKSIASLEVRADSIESRVSTVENDVVTAFTQISQNSSSITQLAGQFSSFKSATESDLKGIRDNVTSITSDISGLRTNITNINTRIDNLNIPDVSGILSDISALKDRLNKFNSENSTLEAQWSSLQTSIEGIRAEVNNLQYNGTLELWSTIMDLKSDLAEISSTYVKSSDVVTIIESAGFITSSTASSLFASKTYVDTQTGNVRSYVDTQISATVDGFSLTYVKNTNVIAAINGSSEGITINANKIKLEGYTSINGSFSVDTNGDINLYGIVRYATDYLDYGTHDKDDNAMIVNIRPYATTLTIGLGIGEAQLGKIFRIYNENALGGAAHYINAPRFTYSSSGSRELSSTNYSVGAQEFIEMTCMKMNSGTAEWICTNRFTYQLFRNAPTMGRYPLVWAMGQVVYNPNNSNPLSVTGYLYNGTALSSVVRATRLARGNYQLTFDPGTIPSAYHVFATPNITFDEDDRTEHISGAGVTVRASVDRVIRFYCSDDASLNDCTFSFIIFDSENWYYK